MRFLLALRGSVFRLLMAAVIGGLVLGAGMRPVIANGACPEEKQSPVSGCPMEKATDDCAETDSLMCCLCLCQCAVAEETGEAVVHRSVAVRLLIGNSVARSIGNEPELPPPRS